MRVTALIMGVLGGVFGLLAAIVVLGIGDIASHLGAGNEAIYLAVGAIACSAVGIIGGALSGSRPGWSAILLLIAGVGIVIAISYFGLLSGILFLLGALFAGLEYRNVRTLDRLHEAPANRAVVARRPDRPGPLVAPTSALELPPIPTPRTTGLAKQTAIPPPATIEPDSAPEPTPGPFCTACGHPFPDHEAVFCARCGGRRFMIVE